MNCTFQQYLIDVGVRSSEYTYEREELIKHVRYFKKCWKSDLSAYKALLFLTDHIKEINLPEYTGYYDDNGKAILVGDKLKSEWGYEVIVYKEDNEFLGKLACNKKHSCKDIPYALNKGEGYTKVETTEN